MKTARILPLLFTALLAAPAFGQKTCTKADETNAARAIDRIVSWASLQSTWRNYRHCDTGGVADGFTESILRLVIDWKHVDQLANAMKDPDFKQFIIGHLNSPAAKEDLVDVYSRAKANCPKGQEAFCKDLAEAVMPTKAAAPAAAGAPAAAATAAGSPNAPATPVPAADSKGAPDPAPVPAAAPKK